MEVWEIPVRKNRVPVYRYLRYRYTGVKNSSRPKLRSLQLSLRDCTLLENPRALHSLILLTALKSVALDFTGCSNLPNVELRALQMVYRYSATINKY